VQKASFKEDALQISGEQAHRSEEQDKGIIVWRFRIVHIQYT